MSNLLSLKFWLNLRPGPLLPVYHKSFIVFLFFLFILFFISWIIKSKKKNFYTEFWQKINSFSLLNIFIGAILFFFISELIPFLSSRFWFLIWGLGMVIWLVFIFLVLKGIPHKKKKAIEDYEYKKYIP